MSLQPAQFAADSSFSVAVLFKWEICIGLLALLIGRVRENPTRGGHKGKCDSPAVQSIKVEREQIKIVINNAKCICGGS